VFNAKTNEWSTAVLSLGRYNLAATSVQTLAMFAGGATGDLGSTGVKNVDIYDSAKDIWSTAQLSAPVWGLAATSLPTLALFAGGADTGARSVCNQQKLKLFKAESPVLGL
jgi:hypothetical protein